MFVGTSEMDVGPLQNMFLLLSHSSDQAQVDTQSFIVTFDDIQIVVRLFESKGVVQRLRRTNPVSLRYEWECGAQGWENLAGLIDGFNDFDGRSVELKSMTMDSCFLSRPSMKDIFLADLQEIFIEFFTDRLG